MRIRIIGRGRMARALEAALRPTELDVLPLAGRGADGLDDSGSPVDVVLLAVPDAEIVTAASRLHPGSGSRPLVGHLSGATPVGTLSGFEAFGLHPLLTVTGAETSFTGAHAAIAGTTDRALGAARDLAEALGMRTFEVDDPDRAAYHAAASIASNYLLTLEHFAEALAATAGVPREALVPLVRAGVENWARLGAPAALTGPIARGDEETVARQREAVAERLPDRIHLFDALTEATRELAGSADLDPASAPDPMQTGEQIEGEAR